MRNVLGRSWGSNPPSDTAIRHVTVWTHPSGVALGDYTFLYSSNLRPFELQKNIARCVACVSKTRFPQHHSHQQLTLRSVGHGVCWVLVFVMCSLDPKDCAAAGNLPGKLGPWQLDFRWSDCAL